MTTPITLQTLQPLLHTMVQNSTLIGWEARHRTSRSLQRLYASPNHKTLSCHQNRTVDETSLSLTLYTPGKDTRTLGIAMVDITSFRPLPQQLAEAVALARCSINPTWELPASAPTPPQPIATCDPRVRDDADALASEIEQRFTHAFAQQNQCALNSGELFINYRITSVFNSKGNNFTVERSDLYFEAAMEKAHQENDKEVHEYITSVTAADLNIETFVERAALQVSSLGASNEPESTSSATILIHKHAIALILDAVRQQLGCAFEYNRLPFLKTDDTFGGGKDPLTLSLDCTIPCLAQSGAYTNDGLPATAGVLIENNKITNRIIDNRYGQYLDRSPNGLSGNMVLQTGTLTPKALQGTAYFDIIKFSSLLVDERKLTWSSEIKLGRYVAADGTSTLIKGGVVSGNIRENVTNCRFATQNETVNFPGDSYTPPLGYHGPESMLITKGVSIAGTQGGSK